MHKSLVHRFFRFLLAPFIKRKVQRQALGIDPMGAPPQIRKILYNALRLHKLDVSDVLLPRNQVQFFDLNETLQTNIEKAKVTGHTRFPLCEGDLDQCVGLIHIKDIFRFRADLQKLDLYKIKREMVQFPEDTPLEEVLEKMLRYGIHMALVIDEFGGSIGVITLEAILEELVGKIQDEFDTDEEAIIQPLGKGRYRVSGLAPIRDVEELLHIKIDNEEVSTFGGWITAELGRIPISKERIPIASLDIIVEETDGRRVIAGTVRKKETYNPSKE